MNKPVNNSQILAPVKLGARIRRWLGFYTREEKEVISYANRLKQFSLMVSVGKEKVTSRPDWMRHEDYKKLRSLQNKVEKRKRV